jgi:DNA (cytosine-5)-methyltransferase 1
LGEEGYTCGSAVLGAHSVGAPHIRQRLYWVAYDTSAGLEGSTRQELQGDGGGLAWSGEASGVAQPSDNGTRDNSGEASGFRGESVATRAEGIRQAYRQAGTGGADSRSSSGNGWVVNSKCSGLMGSPISNREPTEARREKEPDDNRESSKGCAIAGGVGDTNGSGFSEQSGSSAMEEEHFAAELRSVHGFWNNCTIIPCRDGKSRRIPAQAIIEPVFQHVVDGFSCSLDARRNILNAAQGFPLAETIPGRVALLKGAGNAIVPAVAAEFIAAFMDIEATETALFH